MGWFIAAVLLLAWLVHRAQARKRKAAAPKAAEGCALVAIVDTETTGLAQRDEPIAVAVLLAEVALPKGDVVRVVDQYHGLREPAVPISAGAQAVHGLTLTDVRGHYLDTDRVQRLLDAADMVVAHNAAFDRRMLRKVLMRADRLPWACSMLALRRHWDQRTGRRSLDAICAALAITRPAPHNALKDCHALLQVLGTPSGKTSRSKTFMALLLDNPWCPDRD